MKYLLGIDIGTSACKAVLCDENGNVAASADADYPVYYPAPGCAEQNPEDWWNGVCRAVREVIAKAGAEPRNIASVGVDGQSWSAVAMDKKGNVLCNTPIWFDTRAEEICRKWEEKIGGEEIFRVCGNPVKPSYTAPKVVWYKNNKPEVYKNTYKILQSNGYIVYKLTGAFTQDKSQGYGWQCYDIKNCRWDFNMCEKLGIDAEMLPEIKDCCDVAGTVTVKAAEETGLPRGIPVVAGGLDAACAALGVGVIRAGQTQEQGGQAGGMSICCYMPESDMRLISGCHAVPGKWLLQGGTTGGGGVMRWLERELGDYERTLSVSSGKSSFALMDEAAAKVPAGSDGLIFLPYMAGERSPIWDPNARGVFYGLDFSKTKGHLIRAALEGTAFALRHNLETANEAGAEVTVLRSMGGAANSALWTQVKADVTGKVIEVPSSDTATALGAIILAGVGAGIFGSFIEAVERTVNVKKVYYPNEKNKEIYDVLYGKYKKLYPALREI